MAKKIIFPNYKPAWQYDSFDWSKVGTWFNQVLGNVIDGIWGLNSLKNGSDQQQLTEQRRLELEMEKQRSNTILLVAAMAVGAICLVLIFKK